MARPYRLQVENYLYHITSRGDGRKKIYISKYDYEKFLEYIKQAKEKYKFYLYSYVLMPNHYHLLIGPTQANLSQIMHYINGSYTTYYNIKRRRNGHLFQGRYKSIVVDKDSYFLELTRYIHLNPVRAKMVDSPEKYRWSSYHGYRRRNGDGYIDKDQVKNTLDMTESQYRQFVFDGIGKKVAPFEKLYAGFILGGVKFVKETLGDLKEQVESKEFSYRKALRVNIDEDEILRAVAKTYKRSTEEIRRMKNRPLPERKIAIYLLKRFTGLTNPEIGERFGITFSAVSKAAKDAVELIEKDQLVRRNVGQIISSFKG